MVEIKDSFAHILNTKKENLTDHLLLTKAYFEKLYIEKGVRDAIINATKIFGLGDVPSDFINTLILEMSVYHDYGKVNPLFQSEKMKNKKNVSREQTLVLGTQHSLLSSIIYLDSFLNKLNEDFDRKGEEYKRLRHLIFINAYVISRHHSSLNEFLEYIELMREGKGFDIITLLKDENEYFGVVLNADAEKLLKAAKNEKRWIENVTKEEAFALYTYARILHSTLLAADYYATTEFMSDTKITEFGIMNDLNEFYDEYKNGAIYKKIMSEKSLVRNSYKNINELRNRLFIETEENLEANINDTIFYLEAPTGSGKSNVAMNLAFKIMEKKKLSKIIYVYPFNTLVEQNMEIIMKLFGNKENLMQQIAVVNSITPFKLPQEEDDNTHLYEKALLNRQFLNYPFILTTSVSLFNLMFSNDKNKIFGFHQLMNSVIVIDEVQNYKNLLWTEIIEFLQMFAKVLNLNVIIMSATLPNLNFLLECKCKPAYLIKDRDLYFKNPLFAKRVEIDYSLLGKEYDDILQILMQQLIENGRTKKCVIEFIKKKTAKAFYLVIKEEVEVQNKDINIYLLTGEDNACERKRILSKIKDKDSACILVATQVIEAGVDIDMDIGYKNISLFDSEEQFLGRINRSCLRAGKVYFFCYDKVEKIYRNDYRTNKEIMLPTDKMKLMLEDKDFSSYYETIMELIKRDNANSGEEGLKKFVHNHVSLLDFPYISKRMQLIDERNYGISVFFSRSIEIEDGIVIRGNELWNEYKHLLKDTVIKYEEKQYKLSIVRARMDNFIYYISTNTNILPDDQIGELYYVENGEDYFVDNKLDTERFENSANLFI